MKVFFLTYFVLLTFVAYSQQLRLEWDLLSLPSLELYIFHTKPDGESNRIPVNAESTPTLGYYQISIPQNDGRYQVFVVNPAADDDFADWSSYRWLEYVKLTLNRNNVKIEVTPKPNNGGVWHALDLLGFELEPVIVNQILPRRMMVWGQVFSAETGSPLPQVIVRAQTNQQTVIRDVTNRRGLFLLFLKDEQYQLTFEGNRLIPRDAFYDLKSFPFPHRFDTTLATRSNDTDQIIVLTWDLYPEELNMEIQSDDTIIPALPPNPEASFKSLIFKPETSKSYRLVVSPKRTSDELLFAYSQARVTIHSGTSVITRQMPLGNRSEWIVLNYLPDSGWIETE